MELRTSAGRSGTSDLTLESIRYASFKRLSDDENRGIVDDLLNVKKVRVQNGRLKEKVSVIMDGKAKGEGPDAGK